MEDFGDVTDAQIESIGRRSKAIGTVHGRGVLTGATRFSNPHHWTGDCHLDGEGHGPCFDSRWVEEHENEEQT